MRQLANRNIEYDDDTHHHKSFRTSYTKVLGIQQAAEMKMDTYTYMCFKEFGRLSRATDVLNISQELFLKQAPSPNQS